MAAGTVAVCCCLFGLLPALSQARLFLSPSLQEQQVDDVVLVDYHNWLDAPQSFSNGSFVGVTKTGRNFTAYVAAMYNGLPGNFSFQLPAGGLSCFS